MKTYVVLEEISGISKKSERPYHMLKVADAKTFANHVLSVDPNYIPAHMGLVQGQVVQLEVGFVTDFRGTAPVVEKVTVVK